MNGEYALVHESDIDRFRNDGFMVLSTAVGGDALTILRNVRERLLEQTPAENAPEGYPKPIFLNMLGWNDPCMQSSLFGPRAGGNPGRLQQPDISPLDRKPFRPSPADICRAVFTRTDPQCRRHRATEHGGFLAARRTRSA